MAGKKKKKKKRSKKIPAITYDYNNIVQVICGNCGHATMVNPNITGLKSCYFCNSAIHVPKLPKNSEENDENGENSEAGDEFNDGSDNPEDSDAKEKKDKEKDNKKITAELEKSLNNMTPDDIVF